MQIDAKPQVKVGTSVKVKRNQWNKLLTISLFVAPAFIIYAIYVIYPIFATFNYSLHEWNSMQSEKTFIGFANYVELFNDQIFWTALKNNFLVVFISVFVQIPLGLVMALMLFAPIRGIKLFNTIYFMPFLMSTVAIGLLWVFMFDPINGTMNQLLRMLGVEKWQVAWLSEESTAMWSVLLVIVWQFAPFYMILFKAGIVGIPEELYEAAQIDGANKWKQFTHITFPLLMPTIVSSSILAIVGSLKTFDLFYIMTGGGPNNATELMGTYMFKQAFQIFDMGYASTIAFMMFFIAFIVVAIIQVMETQRRKKGGYL
nr:sugar ABC transporter permease [Ammoniphilus resinae]